MSMNMFDMRQYVVGLLDVVTLKGDVHTYFISDFDLRDTSTTTATSLFPAVYFFKFPSIAEYISVYCVRLKRLVPHHHPKKKY